METRTRSGRVSKPPTRYEPVEIVEDDFSDSAYDDDETDGDDEEDEEDEDEEDDDDAGSLNEFVVDDSDSDSDKSEDEVKPSNGRKPVPKRRGPSPATGTKPATAADQA